MGEEAWYVEVGIPWQDLGVQPHPGQVYGLNVCRDRSIGADREWEWAKEFGLLRVTKVSRLPQVEPFILLED